MVAAMTSSPSFFFIGLDSSVMIAWLRSLRALLDYAARRHALAGTNQYSVTLTELGDRHLVLILRSYRIAVSGRSLASSLSGPFACAIERISTQWPSSMMVTKVAKLPPDRVRLDETELDHP